MSANDLAIVHVVPVDARMEDSRVGAARSRLMVARQRTRTALSALRTEVKERADWHTWYRASPEAFLGAAFLVGFLLAKRR